MNLDVCRINDIDDSGTGFWYSPSFLYRREMAPIGSNLLNKLCEARETAGLIRPENRKFGVVTDFEDDIYTVAVIPKSWWVMPSCERQRCGFQVNLWEHVKFPYATPYFAMISCTDLDASIADVNMSDTERKSHNTNVALEWLLSVGSEAFNLGFLKGVRTNSNGWMLSGTNRQWEASDLANKMQNVKAALERANA